MPEQPQTGDVYLLCSDGLSGMMTDDVIRELVMASEGDVEAAAKALVERANANGGEDNVTVVLLEVTD